LLHLSEGEGIRKGDHSKHTLAGDLADVFGRFFFCCWPFRFWAFGCSLVLILRLNRDLRTLFSSTHVSGAINGVLGSRGTRSSISAVGLTPKVRRIPSLDF